MNAPTYLMGILGIMALLLAGIVAVLLNRLSGRTVVRVQARPLLSGSGEQWSPSTATNDPKRIESVAIASMVRC